MSKKTMRLIFAAAAFALFATEFLIALYATGWVRAYLGDVLVVILLYALFRAVSVDRPSKWFVLPAAILIIAFCVEFLQMWGIAARLGITNRVLLILIGTSFSVVDLLSYAIGIIPCFVVDYLRERHMR